MTGTPPAVTVSLLTRMLREAFDGPPGPWTYFTDTSPGTGVFGTISGLSAADASHTGGPGRTTIAGHVHHLTSSVALSARGLRGESTSRDRSRSWTVSAVDNAEWAALRARLRDEYERLLVAVETHAVWDEDALGVAIGALGHAAYHLGAIRQRLPVHRPGAPNP
jgi:DinB family protein